MGTARHPMPPEVQDLSLEQVMDKYVARFADRPADWYAFEDAKIEGFKRAQHRFIGAGASGKHDDPNVVPARGFTLTIMFVNPGQGNAAHTHESEECFFVLRGFLDVFVEDEAGRQVWQRLGPWDCVSCPPGVIHGYENRSLEPVYFQVMHGRARPETMGYADAALFDKRDEHLKAAPTSAVTVPV
ncbi:MAG: cupin domain-containing protein [Proteobacteria bacterium]|nr:cupin domain-containing protein [Burkholderiales bacterium]